MNAAVTDIAVKAPGFGVDAPDAELGGVERQLQPLIAIPESRLISPALGEQGGQD